MKSLINKLQRTINILEKYESLSNLLSSKNVALLECLNFRLVAGSNPAGPTFIIDCNFGHRFAEKEQHRRILPGPYFTIKLELAAGCYPGAGLWRVKTRPTAGLGGLQPLYKKCNCLSSNGDRFTSLRLNSVQAFAMTMKVVGVRLWVGACSARLSPVHI